MWGGIQASKKIKPRSGSHKNTLLHRSVEMALVYMYWRTHLLAGIYPRNQINFEPSHWLTKCTGNGCYATWLLGQPPTPHNSNASLDYGAAYKQPRKENREAAATKTP